MSKNWFKLHNDFMNDQKVQACLNEHGHQAIMVWIFLLAECHKQINGESHQKFKINIPHFAKICKTYPNKLVKILYLIEDYFELNCELIGNNLEIFYPKFLDIQRNYGLKIRKRSEISDTDKIRLDKIRLEKENIKRKVKKEISKNAKEIFDHWNAKGIKVHKEINDKLLKRIKNTLKIHSLEDIKEAINNYDKVLKLNGFFKYKWTLAEFLQREGSEKFYPGNFDLTNWINGDNDTMRREGTLQDRLIRVGKQLGELN